MFKDDTHRKHILDDIKTMFDGLKSLGLCFAITLGLQWLQEPMINAGFSYELRGMVYFLGLTLSVFLTATALFWTFCSLKTEPTFKGFHKFSVLILIVIALAAMIAVLFASYQHAPFAHLG